MTPQVATPTAVNAEKDRIYQWVTEQYWTEETYLALSESTNQQVELSEGALQVLPMPTREHQRILKRFIRLLDAWLEAHRAGEVLFAAHPIRLWPGKYREPDAMAWATEHLKRMGPRESGPPDLALEILSPSNSELDLQIKFQEYAQAGIPEYWIVDPEAQQVAIYQLDGPAYQLLGRYRAGDQAASVVFAGFSIAVNELFSPQ